MQEEKSQYLGPRASTDRRILGWCRRRIRLNKRQIWFRFDTGDFHETTGCSIRSIRYALKSLRDDEEGPLKFRTVFDRSIGPKGAWSVLYASRERLRYDREPLHRDREDRPRHVRPRLRESEVSATPIYRRDTSYLSRVETPSKSRGSGVLSRSGEKRLRGAAGGIARRLEKHHWDNCKVDWEFVPLRGFVFRWLREGLDEAEISKAYDAALHWAHMMATDIGLNDGNHHHRFNVSSTIKRAGKALAQVAAKTDRDERIRKWYRDRNQMRAQIREQLETALAS